LDTLIEKINEFIKGLLVSGIMDILTNTFNTLTSRIDEVSNCLGQSPSDFQPAVFSMIRNLSENVIMPIAGIVLTFIACYELIQLVMAHNNLANFETWIFFKWVFKTFLAVLLISNTMTITMAVFDVAQHVVNSAGGLIQSSTDVDIYTYEAIQNVLNASSTGELFSIFLQSFVVQFLIYILSALIFVIVYARMIEIYLMVSLAPIPFATFGNKEQSMIGQNYVRSLFALGFQGFLIMVCVGIYAVLIQTIALDTDIIGSLWGVMGYTILLAFTLFKTGTIAKSIFNAH
jgi:hypothetical protein